MVFGIVPKLQNALLQRYNFSPRTRSLLTHPAGPFTIFFWCPFVKWCIVGANITDLRIPAENLSVNQQIVVVLTGFTWSRNSTVIIPYNLNLALVNFFLGCTGVYQLSRIFRHYSDEKKTEQALATN